MSEYSRWFNQTGVTLSQHTSGDGRFPGWQERFGEGTFQADYTSGGVFPNDDASHIEVEDGWEATIMQNSYVAGNQSSSDKEETFFGPTSEDLTDYDMNDMVSEVIVRKLESDSDDNQDGNNGSSSSSDSEPKDVAPQPPTPTPLPPTNDMSNTILYVVMGVVILGLGVMVLKSKKTVAAPIAAPTN